MVWPLVVAGLLRWREPARHDPAGGAGGWPPSRSALMVGLHLSGAVVRPQPLPGHPHPRRRHRHGRRAGRLADGPRARPGPVAAARPGGAGRGVSVFLAAMWSLTDLGTGLPLLRRPGAVRPGRHRSSPPRPTRTADGVRACRSPAALAGTDQLRPLPVPLADLPLPERTAPGLHGWPSSPSRSSCFDVAALLLPDRAADPPRRGRAGARLAVPAPIALAALALVFGTLGGGGADHRQRRPLATAPAAARPS